MSPLAVAVFLAALGLAGITAIAIALTTRPARKETR